MRWTTRIVTATVALAVLAVASPAAAQLAPGQSGTSTTRYVEGDEVWRALTDFADCYASERTPKALELVSTPAGSVEEVRTYKRLFRDGDNCLRLVDTMNINFQMVRGAIAEGLYRRAVPVPAALAVVRAPTIAQVRTFAEAALCFTGVNRAAVANLIASTRPGSKAEDQALDRLLPGVVASCVPEKARSLKLAGTLIRYRLAEALWRLGGKPAVAGRAK